MTTDLNARALRHRAEQLASLKKVEAFQFLAGEVQKKRGRMAEQLAAMILNGTEEVPQRQVDWNRGFIAGMLYVTENVISGAERKLEKDSEPEDELEEDNWSGYTPTG